MDIKKVKKELEKRYAKRELAKRKYKEYLKLINYNFKEGKHIDFLVARLQKLATEKRKRLIISLPPRHSKSFTITETYPSWIMQRNESTNVIISAYSGTLAKKFGGSNKDKVNNKIFETKIANDERSKDTWKLTNGSRLIARGIGGAITGEGADLLIIDDPVKNQLEASSKTYRDRIWSEWESTLSTRLSPGANVIVIMTRWHKDDLAGRLEETKKWEIINIPALAENENDVLGRKKGEPLWASYGFDKEWAEETRQTVGSRVWSALYQGKPTDDDNGLFKRENIRYYKEEGEHFKLYNEEKEIIILKNSCLKFQTLDTALKIEEQNDYTVLSTFYLTKTNDILISKYRQEKIEVPKQYNFMKNEYLKEKPAFIGIENKQSGIGLIQRAKTDRVTVKELKATESKELRAVPISIEYENGKVYHNLEMAGLEMLEEELLGFPNEKHDDIVDTIAYAGKIKQKYTRKAGSRIRGKRNGF